MSAFRGKPASGGGDFALPPAGTHDAVLVALIDMGTHMESYQGATAAPKRKAYLVWELVDCPIEGAETNHVIGREYTLSFHEMGGLRILAEKLVDESKLVLPDGNLDYTAMLGVPCLVTVKHEESSGGRTFGKLTDVGAMPEKYRPKTSKPKNKPFSWSVEDDKADVRQLPKYLPWTFANGGALPVPEKCQQCLEWKAEQGGTAATPNPDARKAAPSSSDVKTPWDDDRRPAPGARRKEEEIPY